MISLLKKEKVQMALIVGALVVGLTLGGAALGISEEARSQAVEALLWLGGVLIGGHALTDAARQRRGEE